MPIHDWTRVDDGIFHHLHLRWMGSLSDALNEGLLPKDFYALAEQFAGPLEHDVLTLHEDSDEEGPGNGQPSIQTNGPIAGTFSALIAPPRVAHRAQASLDHYQAKQRRLSIRHTSNDRIIAIIEIVSRGNKSSHQRFRAFVDKSVEALYRGIHLLVIDLHSPTKRNPNGIHGAIWAEISPDPYGAPAKPLTLASYDASDIKTAYVEPIAIGDRLIDMPLFIAPDTYINVPLDSTYAAAFAKVPQRWRTVLEEPA